MMISLTISFYQNDHSVSGSGTVVLRSPRASQLYSTASNHSAKVSYKHYLYIFKINILTVYVKHGKDRTEEQQLTHLYFLASQQILLI